MTLPRVVLAHGAAGTAETMRPYVEGLRARGVEALALGLPKRGRSPVPAESAIPVFAAAAEPAEVVGGHSYGGRVASLLAARRPQAGLVLYSYPLHAPGRFETWEERTAHWPAIRCPVLLLSGEADPFARLDLLERAAERQADVEVHTYPGVRHGLGPVIEEAVARTAAFVARAAPLAAERV